MVLACVSLHIYHNGCQNPHDLILISAASSTKSPDGARRPGALVLNEFSKRLGDLSVAAESVHKVSSCVNTADNYARGSVDLA